ncbi:methyltransferase domain-containing protein [Kitasatospora sp. NA04385]|uniref:methyltransferase domain-containing protein n=1 Tax=Kitasatospora sp. NA04385 TaxID=2742135 RepID=UPI0015903242|nr:methyltransferase domain-containing protein [Kitasatospora sp. NA04385]QKW20527.1 methyltransferase domain-containing protein [Kitasatospora sp. NA04385]
MSDSAEAIHSRLAELIAPMADSRIIDLGCGSGPTLLSLSRLAPDATLIGVDRSPAFLGQARQNLQGHPGTLVALAADLRSAIPCGDGSADAVLSYNTVECLPDPDELLAEIARVLRPGGRAVLAHVDFDSLVIAGADADLDRRVCHAYADDVQNWMDHADGRIGRKLGLLLARSALRLVSVEPLLTWSTELSGHAEARIGEIRKALLSADKHGRGAVSAAEVEKWFATVREADRLGGFFFSELAFIAVAERPSEERLAGGTAPPTHDGILPGHGERWASTPPAAA